GFRRVYRCSTAVQQEIVDAVLHKVASVGGAEDAPIVRLVLGEKESRCPSHFSCQTPSCGWLAVIVSPVPVIAGFIALGLPVHRFRNHSVGSRCSRLGAEPRLCTVSRIRISSADALLYS